jgi:hypothetical protein
MIHFFHIFSRKASTLRLTVLNLTFSRPWIETFESAKNDGTLSPVRTRFPQPDRRPLKRFSLPGKFTSGNFDGSRSSPRYEPRTSSCLSLAWTMHTSFAIGVRTSSFSSSQWLRGSCGSVLRSLRMLFARDLPPGAAPRADKDFVPAFVARCRANPR